MQAKLEQNAQRGKIFRNYSTKQRKNKQNIFNENRINIKNYKKIMHSDLSIKIKQQTRDLFSTQYI